MMSLTFERWYPIIFGTAGCAISWLGDAVLPISESFQAGLLSAAISAASIFVGFIATSKSILMALPSAEIKKDLKESGFLEVLATYLNHAMFGNLIFCAFNIVGFFPIAQSHSEIFTPIWIGLGIFCASAFWRVGSAMTVILRLS